MLDLKNKQTKFEKRAVRKNVNEKSDTSFGSYLPKVDVGIFWDAYKIWKEKNVDQKVVTICKYKVLKMISHFKMEKMKGKNITQRIVEMDKNEWKKVAQRFDQEKIS